ncbi:Bug family tripartite tricarboxylate transporter substrate binding protein [Caenimonas terrae]|uniref:Bug family tripartite tricarboxylate transporter substrate binding protein n=1 Tax=Caenimonas terrae TaxID=696074 RepID=A0ABW0NBD9_9BURK
MKNSSTTGLTRRAALVTLAAAGAGGLQAAQPAGSKVDFGGKPLRIIVPFTAGGSSDIIARAIAQPLGEALGTTVIVDNKVGANGNIGADFVAKAPADGSTLLLCDVRALAISPSFYKLPFNPARDLQGVAMLAYSPHLLVVHPSVPVNNLKELVELSKKKHLTFAVTALGSAPHLAGVQIAERTGAKWSFVPYKGGSQAINDTMAGTTDVLMNGMLATLPFVQAKRLKILAVSKLTRVALLPDVPTIAETLPGFESGTWQGVLAPAGMPPAVLSKISSELLRIIRLPAVREQLVAQGAEVSTMPPAEITRFVDTEIRHWQAVVTKAGLKLE